MAPRPSSFPSLFCPIWRGGLQRDDRLPTVAGRHHQSAFSNGMVSLQGAVVSSQKRREPCGTSKIFPDAADDDSSFLILRDDVGKLSRGESLQGFLAAPGCTDHRDLRVGDRIDGDDSNAVADATKFEKHLVQRRPCRRFETLATHRRYPPFRRETYMLRRYWPPTSKRALAIWPSDSTRTASISTAKILPPPVAAC